MDIDWTAIILIILGYLAISAILAYLVGCMFAYQYRDDQDVEYMNKHSDLKMLKKQAGGKWK